MIMSDLPVPASRTALLVPDLRDARTGRPLPVRGATLHRYSHTEEKLGTYVFERPDGSRGVDGRDVTYEFIFRCEETGATRAYGCTGPNTPGLYAPETDDEDTDANPNQEP